MMAGTGHAIFFETSAGVNYSDADYAESGAIPVKKQNLFTPCPKERSTQSAASCFLPTGIIFPVPDSVSEINGIAAISVASELLSIEREGILGGIAGVSPAEIIVIFWELPGK
jgi:alanine dehydrogenase